MKIFMIGQKGIPATYGGIERHAEELAIRLAKENEVFVFCRSYYINYSGSIYKGVNLIKLPTIKLKHLDTFLHTLLCVLYVLPKKADIIHIHAQGPSLLIPLLKLKRKTRIVVTSHALDWRREKWGLVAKISLRLGDYFAIKQANDFIVISKSLKGYYHKNYQRNTIHVPNGVVIRPQKPLQKMEKYKIKKDGYILTVARLVPEKGIHYLIEAFKKINTDLKLVIVGDDPYNNLYITRLRKLAQGHKNIIFTGYLYDNSLSELYSNAYLYVQPSDLEGSPITLLEAMSFNNVVLVSNIPGHREIIKNKLGFSFRAGSIDSLAKMLRKIINNPKSADIIKESKPREFVRQYYSWDKMAEAVKNIYKANKK